MSRQHHYWFAHRVLPVTPPDAWRGLAARMRAGESIDPVLTRVWRSVGSELPGDDRLEPDGLTASLHTVGVHDVIIVTMPPPAEPPEAYFGAAVIPIDPDAPVRYMTLELGFDPIQRRPYTVGGEWTSEAHVNLGDGPPPTVPDYLAWLQPRIADR